MRSYIITTSDGVVCRKMQAHLKPYIPQNKKSQAKQCMSQLMAQSDHIWPVKTNDGTIRPQVVYTSEQSITSTYQQT